MKEKRILTFRSGEQQQQECLEWLTENAVPRQGACIIGGSRVAADELVRSLADVKGGIAGVSRYSLIHLACELAGPGLARGNKLPLTSLSEAAILKRVIHKVLLRHALRYFAPVAEMPGFARALGATLNHLQLDRVEESRLIELGPAGEDLALFLKSYRDELSESGLADRSQILACAESALASRSGALPVVLLDCRLRGVAEIEFIGALLEWASASLATVQEGDELGLESLRAAYACELEPWDRSSTRQPVESRLERLRKGLFGPDAAEVDPASDDSLSFFSAAEESRECVEIVRQIRDSVSKGVRFDEVAVLLRQPFLYFPLIEDAFRRAEIPVFMTRGTRRPHPSGRAFLALLQCASENLSASRFAEYLSLGQVPQPDPQGAPPVQVVEWVAPSNEQLVLKTVLEEPHNEEDEVAAVPEDASESAAVVAGNLRTPHRWEQLLVDASVIGGKERWESRLRGLARELELQLRRLDPDEEAQQKRLRRKIHFLGHLTRFAEPLVAELDGLREPAKWSNWLSRLELLAGMSLRWPASVLSVLSELRPMAEVGPVALDEVEAILTERLKFLQTEPSGSRYGKVFVGGLDEVSGMAFRAVFAPGLAEGVFPQKPREDPLLLDRDRARIGLPLSLERANHDERLLLRTAVSVASERLTISYPRMELAQGRPRVPSFYFLDVLRAAEGRLPDVRELERRAAAASISRLGWPAPPRPETALDDSEYDLARLESALHAQVSPPRGEARFLLEVNAALARSLRSRWSRWSARGFSKSDGFITEDPEALELIRQESMYRRSFSPTALQNFAHCPYRFFLYAVHRLQLREEQVAIEQMDPLTRGALFHEVQFKLFNHLQERGELPIRPENRQAVEAQAESLLQEVSDHFLQELAPAIPSIWEGAVNGLAADLRGWIRRVAESKGDWIPYRFEYAFGLPVDSDRDSHSQPDPVQVFDGILLRGSIDLVESDRKGQFTRVTDHKTGKPPRAAHLVVNGGEILQPILYGVAAETLTQRPVLEGRLSYCTQRGDFQVRSVTLDDLNQEKARHVLGVIEDSIQQGFLPAAPNQGACRLCDYRSVCGPYEELRVARKRPDRLEAITRIRGLP